MTRARASSAPAGADEAPARAPRRAIPLRAGQMRQRRAPASGPRDCCARLAQAGVRNPCDQTPPFGHRQQGGGAPRFTRLRQAPPASSDNERGHRRRAGGDLRSPRSAAPSDPARNIPAGRAYANPRFCTPALPAPVLAICETSTDTQGHDPAGADADALVASGGKEVKAQARTWKSERPSSVVCRTWSRGDARGPTHCA